MGLRLFVICSLAVGTSLDRRAGRILSEKGSCEYSWRLDAHLVSGLDMRVVVADRAYRYAVGEYNMLRLLELCLT